MTEDLAVTLARVEGKLDAYAAQRVQDAEKIAELDTRLRDSASSDTVSKLDERVRVLETRPVVTPAGLVGALSTFGVLLGAIAGVVALIH